MEPARAAGGLFDARKAPSFRLTLKLLDFYQVPVRGRTIVLFNNSLILGRPLGSYLESLGGTVIHTFDQTPAPRNPVERATGLAGCKSVSTSRSAVNGAVAGG